MDTLVLQCRYNLWTQICLLRQRTRNWHKPFFKTGSLQATSDLRSLHKEALPNPHCPLAIPFFKPALPKTSQGGIHGSLLFHRGRTYECSNTVLDEREQPAQSQPVIVMAKWRVFEPGFPQSKYDSLNYPRHHTRVSAIFAWICKTSRQKVKMW